MRQLVVVGHILASLLLVMGIACGLLRGGSASLALVTGATVIFGLSAVVSMWRIGRRGLSLVILAALLFCLFLWTRIRPLDYWFCTIGWGNRTFDSIVWQRAAREQGTSHCARGQMLRSLLRARLIGMSRPQVRRLLGGPDMAYKTDRFHPASDAERATIWGYGLGMYSGFRMDMDVLEIIFGPDDRVESWSIEQT